mgnify:FL=1
MRCAHPRGQYRLEEPLGSSVMNSTSLPTHANVAVIEAAYEAWLRDHNSVDPTWRAFFQGFTLAANGTSPAAAMSAAATSAGQAHVSSPIIDSLKQSRVHQLINAYRSIGHLEAHIEIGRAHF